MVVVIRIIIFLCWVFMIRVFTRLLMLSLVQHLLLDAKLKVILANLQRVRGCQASQAHGSILAHVKSFEMFS